MGLSAFLQELVAFLQGLVHRNSSGTTARTMYVPDMQACPKCKQTDAVVRIQYGYIDRRLLAEPEEDIVIGGCVIGGNDPCLACKRCGVGFAFPFPDESQPWIEGYRAIEARKRPDA